MKTHINLSIDDLIWNQAKLKIKNISGEIESYLKVRIGPYNQDGQKEIILLQKERSEKAALISDIAKEVTILDLQISERQAEEKQQGEESLQKAKLMLKSLRNSRVLH